MSLTSSSLQAGAGGGAGSLDSSTKPVSSRGGTFGRSARLGDKRRKQKRKPQQKADNLDLQLSGLTVSTRQGAAMTQQEESRATQQEESRVPNDIQASTGHISIPSNIT